MDQDLVVKASDFDIGPADDFGDLAEGIME
jgi:hypothetical protein